jgi:hypothetical protein
MVKRIFLSLVLALVLCACSSTRTTLTPVPPGTYPIPCETKVLKAEEVFVGKEILIFASVDENCDGECDGVVVFHYLGIFNGQHEFEFVGQLTCEEAPAAIEKLRAEGMKMGVSL